MRASLLSVPPRRDRSFSRARSRSPLCPPREIVRLCLGQGGREVSRADGPDSFATVRGILARLRAVSGWMTSIFFFFRPPPSLPSFLQRDSFYFLRFSVRGEGRVIGLRFVSDTLRDGIIRSSIYVYIFFNRLGGRSNIHLLIRTCKVYCYIYTYGFVGSDYEYYEVRFFDFFP